MTCASILLSRAISKWSTYSEPQSQIKALNLCSYDEPMSIRRLILLIKQKSFKQPNVTFF